MTATMTDRDFGALQVCRITGVSYRQCDYWARTDLVVPSVSEAHGSGTRRRYSYGDVLAIMVVKHMLDAGLSLQSVRKVIEVCRGRDLDDVGTDYIVVTSSGGAALTHVNDVVWRVRHGGFVSHVVPLAQVVDDLDERIALLSL